jgi:hypothetical protein
MTAIPSPETLAYIGIYLGPYIRNINGGTIVPGTIDLTRLNFSPVLPAEFNPLVSRVAALEGQGDSYESIFDSLSGGLGDVNTSVSALNARISTLETSISPVAAGRVLGTGTAAKIRGATSSRLALGHYRITLVPPRDNTDYVVQVSPEGDGSRTHSAYVLNRTTATFDIEISEDDDTVAVNALVDHPFNFTVLDWSV